VPLVDWNLRATFDAAYDVGFTDHGGPPVQLRYHRAVLFPDALNRARALAEILSITSADTVCVVGAAFGWTAEALQQTTGCQAAGVDTSRWIQDARGASEETELDAAIVAAGLNPAADLGAVAKQMLVERGGGPGNRGRLTVLSEQLNNNASRIRVRGLFSSGRITVVVTDDFISGLSDAEVATIAGRVAQLDPGNIRVFGHYLTTTGTTNGNTSYAGVNWKSGPAWRTFLDGLGLTAPLHVIIEAGTFRIF
jgi:hypothetical protein